MSLLFSTYLWLKQLIITKIGNDYEDQLWFYKENEAIFDGVLEYKLEKKN